MISDPSNQFAEANAGKAECPTERKTRIVLVGDSTVAERTGWGLGFKEFLAPEKIECINLALGGRSSLSYRKEGLWTNALALRGDYYLFQFGHNNQPGKPGRSTDMATFVADMKRYVDETRTMGAQPVLITPLTRRQWDENQPGKIKSTLESYAEAIRKLADEHQVPLVDLHARSIELCEQWGPEKCLAFSPIMMTEGRLTEDDTHINGIGRVLFARAVVNELCRAVPELEAMFLNEPRNATPQIAEDAYDAVVSHDVSADYKDLQAALDAATNDITKPFRLLLLPGIYHGQFVVPRGKGRIELIGEDMINTIISFAPNSSGENVKPNGDDKSAAMLVLADNFRAENITFQNTVGVHEHPLALRVESERATFKNCRMIGRRETLVADGGQVHLENCLVEGGQKSISGSAKVKVENCEIHKPQ